MKRLLSIITVFALVLSLAACGDNTSEDTPAPQADTGNTATDQEVSGDSSNPEAGRSLVVYFSWSGNTQNVAESIQSQTDADIFEIQPQTPYSQDYDTVVDLAQEEQGADARPEIANTIDNLEQYDVIYVGFPNWWGDMPMILYTFFDTYDLSGKTIAPFCTSGGSGLSDTVDTMRTLEPEATVVEGLHIGSDSASDPDAAVSQWLSQIAVQ